jgi:hypothetical protein
VTISDALSLIVGLAQGIGVAAAFLLALLIGVCVLLGLPKLRVTSRVGFTRSLDELVGDPRHASYLSPDLPRGPVDQLRPVELPDAPPRPSGR